MAKMVPKIVKRAGTLNRHLRVNPFINLLLHLSWFFEKKNDNDLFVPYDIQTYLDIIIDDKTQIAKLNVKKISSF